MKKIIILIMLLLSFNLFPQQLKNNLNLFIDQNVIIRDQEIIIDLSCIKSEDELIYNVSYILSIIYYYQDSFIEEGYQNIFLHTKDNVIIINKKEMMKFLLISDKEQNEFIINKIKEIW